MRLNMKFLTKTGPNLRLYWVETFEFKRRLSKISSCNWMHANEVPPFMQTVGDAVLQQRGLPRNGYNRALAFCVVVSSCHPKGGGHSPNSTSLDMTNLSPSLCLWTGHCCLGQIHILRPYLHHFLWCCIDSFPGNDIEGGNFVTTYCCIHLHYLIHVCIRFLDSKFKGQGAFGKCHSAWAMFLMRSLPPAVLRLDHFQPADVALLPCAQWWEIFLKHFGMRGQGV